MNVISYDIPEFCDRIMSSSVAESCAMISFIERRRNRGKARHEFILMKAIMLDSSEFWVRVERMPTEITGALSWNSPMAVCPNADKVSIQYYPRTTALHFICANASRTGDGRSNERRIDEG